MNLEFGYAYLRQFSSHTFARLWAYVPNNDELQAKLNCTNLLSRNPFLSKSCSA